MYLVMYLSKLSPLVGRANSIIRLGEISLKKVIIPTWILFSDYIAGNTSSEMIRQFVKKPTTGYHHGNVQVLM